MLRYCKSVNNQVSDELRNKFYDYYIQYSLNKHSVLATWALAIGTLLLSGITLYFNFI